MNDTPLGPSQIQLLRERQIITSEEVVYKSGDLFIAENVLTKNRRILQNCEPLLQEGRRILKG